MIRNVSFIIPIYNEKKRLYNLKDWIKWFDRNTLNCELVLSLNGCNDGSKKLIKNIKFKNLVVLNKRERGRGYAIINALKKTKKKYSCICSIDNAWDKKFYIEAYKKINKQKDIFCIYGPKDHKKSKQKRIFIRRIISIFSNFFLKFFFFGKINQDTQCIKLFKNNKKFNSKLKNYNYFFDTHFYLVNKDLNLKFLNIPVKVNDDNKHSKVKLSSMFEFIYDALKYLINKP